MKNIDQKTISAGELTPQFTPGTPFMVEGCMVLSCISGHASFMLNFRKYDINPGDVVFLFNDMVVELGGRSDDFRLRYVTVDSAETLGIYMSITSQKFWDRLYLSPVRRFGEDSQRHFTAWMSTCCFVYDTCSREVSSQVICDSTLAMFRVMEDMAVHSGEETESFFSGSIWEIAGNFFVLLSRHYKERHKVRFYADALNITPDYLSVIMKEATGKTPKEIIESKLVLAAKALLKCGNLPVKSIAERLNYDDSSHLCKVFRRHTGMSPMEYRRL